MMSISHIFRFEKLRDGGSLIVSFQRNDSCQYWLMFPKAGGDLDDPIFGEPVLINRTTGVEICLSLNSAKNWLRALEPYFEDREELTYVSKESETIIFNTMLALCDANT